MEGVSKSSKRFVVDTMGLNEGNKIMVFRPTMEEFKDFSGYVHYMESRGAHKAGIAKIIPPKEWHAVKQYNMRRIGEMVIDAPVSQTVTGQQGLFQLFNVTKKSLKVKEFKELAESSRYRGPDDYGCLDTVERQFWKNVTFNPPIYGADMPGSIYDKDVHHWNICNLGTILDLLNSSQHCEILGVNTPYLYFGMWKSMFPWHTEDMDLYSINYLHFGAPKSWYAISPDHGKRLETLAKGFFSGSFRDCPEFLRHKMTMISPHVLKKFSIQTEKMTQYEGEFIITFPYGYHAGYNLGFNCAESTNFASKRWIDVGKKARFCECKCDSVKIDMDIFIMKFQPDEWKRLQQERRKERQIDTHNKRKTARANYSSDSKSSKVQVKAKSSSLEMKLKKAVEEVESSDSSGDESSDSDKEEDTTDSEAEDSGELSEEEYSVKKEKGKVETLPRKYRRAFGKAASRERRGNKGKKKKACISKRNPAHKKMKEEEEYKIDGEEVAKKTAAPLLQDLWSHLPANTDSEKAFNKLLSSGETKCAVCVYFSQHDADYLRQCTMTSGKSNGFNGRSNGKLLVTELCFAMDNSEKNSIETAFDLMFGIDKSKELSLLTCAGCCLTVHNSCYGVYDRDKSTEDKWYCDKCKLLNSYYEKFNFLDNSYSNSFIPDIKCSLCCIRGGALKETTSKSWAHIVCAISFPDVSFHNKKDRGPIDITGLNPARKNLNCLYCYHLNKSSCDRGACIQCKCGKCAEAFHATCSFHHGMPLYLGDWPIFIESLCPKHAKFKVVKSEQKRSLVEVSPNDLVLAKHKNGRYYRGQVIDAQMMLYYKVVFDDKSFCFDLPPTDIQGVDAKSNVLPAGEVVSILWPDCVTYRAEITGHWYESLCQIRFEDSSILNVKRSDLYIDGEEIPKKVKAKLSYASEVANKFYLSGSSATGSKRPRNESSRYRSVDKT